MNLEAQLQAGIAALGLALPDGAEQRLLAHLALLDKWNRVYNLTAVRDAGRMVSHHLLDSLAVVPVLDALLGAASSSAQASPPIDPGPAVPPAPASGGEALMGEGAHVARRAPTVIDVGSGGGLPGVVWALMLPALHVHCVDAVGKKAAFVRQAAGELKLRNLAAHHARVEQVVGRYDLVASRAFATLADFVALTCDHLATAGVWVAMKGREPADEIAALPADVEVFHVEPLSVPGLHAERCLVWLRRR